MILIPFAKRKHVTHRYIHIQNWGFGWLVQGRTEAGLGQVRTFQDGMACIDKVGLGSAIT